LAQVEVAVEVETKVKVKLKVEDEDDSGQAPSTSSSSSWQEWPLNLLCSLYPFGICDLYRLKHIHNI